MADVGRDVSLHDVGVGVEGATLDGMVLVLEPVAEVVRNVDSFGWQRAVSHLALELLELPQGLALGTAVDGAAALPAWGGSKGDSALLAAVLALEDGAFPIGSSAPHQMVLSGAHSSTSQTLNRCPVRR